MLSKINRLKRKKEFNFVYKKGKAYYTTFFVLYIVKTKAKATKIGFSVNNKVGNSVIRHKVKRQLTEIFKNYISCIPLNNYVLVAKPNSEKLSFEEKKTNIEILLKKANIV